MGNVHNINENASITNIEVKNTSTINENTANMSLKTETIKTNQSIIGKGIIGFSTKPFETCLKIAAIFNIFLITIIGLVLGYTFLWYYTRFPDFSYQTNKIISAILYGIIAFFIGWILTSFAYGLIFSFLSLKKTCENINKQFDNIAKMLNKK